MATWQPADGSFIGQMITDHVTTPTSILGTRVKCRDMASTN
jgi:hypothetical protein